MTTDDTTREASTSTANKRTLVSGYAGRTVRGMTTREHDYMAHRFAFRKRCGWCGVQLRRWQRDLCRRCGAGAYANNGSAPCAQGARWDAAPDRWSDE